MPRPTRLSRFPRLSVAALLLRALGAAALAPLKALQYWLERDGEIAELVDALAYTPRFDEAEPPAVWPPRPLVVLLSCAEASGEQHALTLLAELRGRAADAGAPPPRVFALGGERLATADAEMLGDPVSRAAMGFQGVLGALPFYFGLLTRTARAFRDERPDLFVPVDSPALHVPMARLARRAGVPVAHFIAPQYWGWAPWRVKGYRRVVDLALSILPFEPEWFRRRGVAVKHVGHPIQDRLADVPADAGPEDGPLVILPGSRAGIVARNLPWMLTVAVRAAEGSRAIWILQEGEEHASAIRDAVANSGLEGRVELRIDALHHRLSEARAALSVSGTVLLDLLHHRLPTVVVYRLEGRRVEWMGRNLLTTPWIASVNLLAGRELLPEFHFHGDGPTEAVESAVRRALVDEGWRGRTRSGLEYAARRLGPPGAARRAAAASLELALGGAPAGAGGAA